MSMSSVMTKTEIFQCLQDQQQVLRDYGVSHCGLFGSFRTGLATERSDVDMLVIFQPEMKTFNNFMDLCFFLEDLLGRKVDVVTPESLSPFFGQRILDEVEYVPLG
ncbi:MAG: nucleotidyltransferase family protein [Alkalinema sp. CAN_BIN05]|nr:nucleotidyltransferase family protein [Alkalinema sp. CAN_BIN05]